MGFTKDLWTRAVPQPDNKITRERTARWGKGKRWLAVWHDEAGAERSRAFTTKDAADKFWQGQETDRERGEYMDPKAGRELLGGVASRWLASRLVDPATAIRYESLYRLHVEPAFGHRQVKASSRLRSRHGSRGWTERLVRPPPPAPTSCCRAALSWRSPTSR